MTCRYTEKQVGEWVCNCASEVVVRSVSGAVQGGEAQRHLNSGQPMHVPSANLQLSSQHRILALSL
jgi:hypothetical protein